MTDYRLHVDMLVPESKHKEFEETMSEFLEQRAFRSFDDTFDNELVLALKRLDPVQFTPPNASATVAPEQPVAKRKAAGRKVSAEESRFLSSEPVYCYRETNEDVYHYVHLWTVPDLEDLDLAKRMLYCSENPLYMKLDGFVLSETQELVRRVRWQEEPEAPDCRMTFVRAIRQFKYQSLGSYLLSLRALVPSLSDRHWHQLGQFQNITGTLNRVTEFWQTDEKSSLADLFATRARSRSSKVAKFAYDVATLPVSVTRESFKWAPYFTRPEFTQRRDRFLKASARRSKRARA